MADNFRPTLPLGNRQVSKTRKKVPESSVIPSVEANKANYGALIFKSFTSAGESILRDLVVDFVNGISAADVHLSHSVQPRTHLNRNPVRTKPKYQRRPRKPKNL